ncbi:MAG: UDP-N-acetylglucosamine 2-epimerase (non-hydrolyzing) [Chitinophagales bacterium]|nr:UDP-N-acetylglucosamine 2-epimerase (non-hydrolyzing) [Chitinophagales bacterium]MDW8427959.1 UDP-N-acetylglucosamine 2-epimerase (non-hydrolyzing) [Chitinophagales bacterium]
MKVVSIVGARPQFIKAAAVSRIMNRYADIQEIIVHTGQHFDDNMSKVFFEELELPLPHVNLGIHSLSHGSMTGRMLEGLEQVLMQQRPDVVLVYGDTNSTLAGALAARKLRLKLAHVEAGMRSFNLSSPEEINRIVTDRLSDFLFCSTSAAVKNLKREGFKHFDCTILKSGDVMYDAALYYGRRLQQQPVALPASVPDAFVLCTLHREENVEDPERLRNILDGLCDIHHLMQVVMPVHPRTRQRIQAMGQSLPLILWEPVSYLQMLQLLKKCRLVITDSGGLQKEAFFFRKYCITLRDETEWVELQELGVNYVVGADRKRLRKVFEKLADKKMKVKAAPYGKGRASEKIVDALRRWV